MQLDPAFLRTSEALGDLTLSHARLQNDARFPWIVLVPRVIGARELEDLSASARNILMDEIVAAGAGVRAIGQALARPVGKLNVGLLGNVTPQLHAHVVGRRADDPAWPGPVWGAGPAEPYATDVLERAVEAAKRSLRL